MSASRTPAGVSEYIRALLASPQFGAQVTHHRVLPAHGAEYGAPKRPWPAAVRKMLAERGIDELYSHQAEAVNHIRAGHAVIVGTPTASGKSLIYNLPVLERHLADPDARALYIFPLKALTQDQHAALHALTAAWPDEARPLTGIYDGDTTDHFRRKLRRDPPHILMTTPEMLHLAILPHHEQWTTFLAGLSYIVLDETHTYRGVLGAHMALVLRRLQRVCARYGARPVPIFCTATVGNPEELAASLTGLTPPPLAITHSGAPQGARHFVFLNPDDSPATAGIALLKAALARNLRTIVYCRSRNMTERMSLWASGQSGQWKERISAYRAGYLPEERRHIESRMHSGELLAVISTSALELGIDIGGLDVCILVGYPGTVMSTLQRGGRVGRGGQESAVILIAGEDALDQYIVRHATDFFQRPAEKAIVNPSNETILQRHLECAAAESPLRPDEAWLASLDQHSLQSALRTLERQGLLLHAADSDEWLAARKRPQRHVDLRGSGETFTIQDADGTVIGMVDGLRAYRETHPGAIYLHRGKSYEIIKLDIATHTIYAKLARASWFTRARGNKHTEILEVYQTALLPNAQVSFGRLRITETITGYEKRSTSGNRLLSVHALDFPPHIFETEGLWVSIPDAVRHALEEQFVHFMGAIHAMEHATIGMLPLCIMADRNDFGGLSTPLHPQTALPTVFVYDALAGGAGLCRAAFGQAEAVLTTTLCAVQDCPCDMGCPSCVHSPKCGSGNRPISKEGAILLLQALLDQPAVQPEYPPVSIVPETLAAVNPAAPPTQPAGRIPGAVPNTDADPLATPTSPSTGITPDAGMVYTPLPPPQRYMVLDVETRRSAQEVGSWHRADKMGVSVAVVYDSQADDYFTYTQEALPDMFALLRQAQLVIGFNTLRFDYAVLQPFAPWDLHRQLPSLDLLVRVKDTLSYRVSLDNIAQATLGEPKSADGLQALQWWQEGNVRAIAQYCRKDVDITRQIYLYGLEHGFVLFTNKAAQRVRARVDFSV